MTPLGYVLAGLLALSAGLGALTYALLAPEPVEARLIVTLCGEPVLGLAAAPGVGLVAATPDAPPEMSEELAELMASPVPVTFLELGAQSQELRDYCEIPPIQPELLHARQTD